MGRKVFVSYSHHLDQEAAESFRRIFADGRDVFIDKSIRDDIGELKAETIKSRLRELIRDSTVTVVLIGKETGGRSWVDWEIYHSLRRSDGKTASALLGVYIPNKEHWVPDRLWDNVPAMGHIINWPRDYRTLANEIEAAFEKAKSGTPDLSRALRERNSSRR
jgi:hypothetical protein